MGVLWGLAMGVLWACTAAAARPHIVFIVGDDLGWNDVGWHNPAIISPNLDRLAREGVILNSSYVQPMCTPSRSAWMTGYYPFHTGMEHYVIVPTQATGLPQYFTLLPQRLKLLGYQTHMVGKWHLGFCDWGYTPTFRGFDSFFGYYEGMEFYYNHTRVFNTMSGVDFRDNEQPAGNYSGIYSAHLFTKKAIDIISQNDPNGDPMFLYLPFQSVHLPLEVPKVYEDMYSNIHDMKRRVYSGMVSAMDEAVGNITNALDKYGYLNNTIIVFTADNGGPTYAGANNLPLRGGKVTLWEGGTKAAAFVYSKTLLSKTGYVNTGMMHAVDWFPTLLRAAGETPGLYPDGMDGVDQWDMISAGGASARQEFVYNIDPLIPNAAIRMGDYKLLLGNPGPFPGWYPLPTEKDTSLETPDLDEIMASVQLVSSLNDTLLFNIVDDPTEHHDLSKQFPDIVDKMRMRLQEHWKSLVDPRDPALDPRGNPDNFGGFWSPGWCDGTP